MADKERLDVLLVQRNLAPGRDQAKAYIMAGTVYVDGMKEDKAGTKVPVTAQIEVRAASMKYVSRGGYKLEKAMEVFPITLEGKICLDIGASTGGFTDCMLQNGAAKVYSIDVGYGQLDWKLRNDERVVCLEKTNVRYVTKEQVPEEADFASIDVSFISLTKVLPAVTGVMQPAGQLVCLIKPQFEAGREKVGKNGVVKDIQVHKDVIAMIADYALANGLGILGLDFSPIKGPKGNIEYLIYLEKGKEGMSREEVEVLLKDVVETSHEVL
ncbi:TlyA family RNA methyltransferase [Anaerotignum lactatifermentans]|uniref:TlyA family RNA methyltransferase n=1 Tax=Anaerotignum lactatifermentans TaxID=160404 RepID=A0ABS2G5P2_9FIRM|nr:TlyA family RNA methyltransferase [Anaerotignum lactatifermentans]MBM6828073.1 TlyA family RNA methyltransferase [Anaerotignum lactatifermentans]MBM6876764.1 TlyA family RNA methyltransferase [Anaerotignum lactatifermentans]MBM6949656.1 TlyA family RNA methyltransferase [Anaerotignum lactatifermentans]